MTKTRFLRLESNAAIDNYMTQRCILAPIEQCESVPVDIYGLLIKGQGHTAKCKIHVFVKRAEVKVRKNSRKGGSVDWKNLFT